MDCRHGIEPRAFHLGGERTLPRSLRSAAPADAITTNVYLSMFLFTSCRDSHSYSVLADCWSHGHSVRGRFSCISSGSLSSASLCEELFVRASAEGLQPTDPTQRSCVSAHLTQDPGLLCALAFSVPVYEEASPLQPPPGLTSPSLPRRAP